MDHPGLHGVYNERIHAFAQGSGQLAILEGTVPYTRRAFYAFGNVPARWSTQTVPQILQMPNSPVYRESGHAVYLERFARIGAVRTDLADTSRGAYAGAEWVGDWYRRNANILMKMLNWMDWKERRIVLIVGAGHAPILRRYFASHRGFRLVEAAEVLPRR